MPKPNLSGRNVATSVSQLNPPAVRRLPTVSINENGEVVKTPKLSKMPRFENAKKVRPHTIEGVIRPAKQSS